MQALPSSLIVSDIKIVSLHIFLLIFFISFLAVLESMTDLMFEKYRSRLAYQSNEDQIKVLIREGLSSESQRILDESDRLIDKKPSLRNEYEKNLFIRRRMVIRKIHRIFKKLEFEIYGDPTPVITEKDKVTICLVNYI